jgi:hypothetical protein
MSEFAGTLRERIIIERPTTARTPTGLQEAGCRHPRCICVRRSMWMEHSAAHGFAEAGQAGNGSMGWMHPWDARQSAIE